MASDRVSQTLRLRDGRLLGYAEYGDPDGKPLFYFHGFPGSRLEAGILDGAAKKRNVRAIGLDRPGVGLSTFKPRRTIAEWPADVAEAADALRIDRFAVAGHSGGAPYVCACAAAMAQRLDAAVIMSGLGPLDAPGVTDGMSRRVRWSWVLFRLAPGFARAAMWYMAQQTRRDPDGMIAQIAHDLSPPDRAVLARPEVAAAERNGLDEAFRQGSRGAAWELRLLARPWGFLLTEVGAPVALWQGESDTWVPPAMGRYLARALPNCRATFLPDEGHLLIWDHALEILSAVTS